MKMSPLKLWLGILAAGFAGLVLYSVHLAFAPPERQETIVLGQSQLALDSPAVLRVIVRDRVTRQPIPDAGVSLSLKNKESGALLPLGLFKTTADGTLNESANLKNAVPGDYTLAVATQSPLGADHIERLVKIYLPEQLLLSADKPVYQPGQTIHLRALLTSGVRQSPAEGRDLTFEISDAKGNKVFREIRKSSHFGLASADFALARELNPGSYRISASSGEATVERAVEIKRYVQPKFKVAIATDKTSYAPGQEMRGTIDAAYFFGQPVARLPSKSPRPLPGQSCWKLAPFKERRALSASAHFPCPSPPASLARRR